MSKPNLSSLDMALINTLFEHTANKLSNVGGSLSAQLEILKTRDKLIIELSSLKYENTHVRIFVGRKSDETLKLVVGSVGHTPDKIVDLIISTDWTTFK